MVVGQCPVSGGRSLDLYESRLIFSRQAAALDTYDVKS